MKSVQLTDKQVKFLKDHFFGQLVIEMDCNGFSTIYEGHIESAKFVHVDVNENKVTATYRGLLFDELVTKTIVIENDCYSVPLEGLGFSEVFCKTE